MIMLDLTLLNMRRFAFNFSCNSYQTCFLSLSRISFLKVFLVCILLSLSTVGHNMIKFDLFCLI